MVCADQNFFSKTFLSFFNPFMSPSRTSQICPSSTLLAVTVPGNEEDCPCISRLSIIRIIQNRTCVRCEHGGNVNLRKPFRPSGNEIWVVLAPYRPLTLVLPSCCLSHVQVPVNICHDLKADRHERQSTPLFMDRWCLLRVSQSRSSRTQQ